MDDLVKLTLSISLPIWGAMAIIAVFATYFAGIAGLGVMFIVIIVVAALWNRTLVVFSERVNRDIPPAQQLNPYETRLRDIESKLDEISRKMRE